MKVFLSWSGDHSRAVADALNELLPRVIRTIEPFYSPKIEKGKKWSSEIQSALKATRFGIVCLTPDNLNSPWLHYEAGALSKTQGALLWTFLHKVKHEDVPSPLGEFQHTVARKDEVLDLLKTINAQLKKATRRPLNDRLLTEKFERDWPQMEKRLEAAERKFAKPYLTLPSFGDLTIVEEVKTFVGDWHAITVDGVHKLASWKPVRSIDLLAVYRAGPIVIGNLSRAKVRICLANMFDAKLVEIYQRLYREKTSKQLRDALVESIQKLLGPCKIRATSAKDIRVTDLERPETAEYDVRLTNQRITFGYFRANEVASIMPLDMKTFQKPAPVAWLLDKAGAPLTFKHYLKQYEMMFEEALPIYVSKSR
ncbi:MAG TPA: TIR domain-containing protein [Pyrinomonadaceae bacterium]|nr:TIR domain-containing protein [Pyrinomonadaceae bacterium]